MDKNRQTLRSFKNPNFPYLKTTTTLDEERALGGKEHHNPKTE